MGGTLREMGKKAKNAGTKKNDKEAKGAGGVGVSEAVQKEFMQQQEKITKAAIQIENMTERKTKQLSELRRAAMTAKEIDGISEDVVLYKQCGKMFLHQPKEDLANQFEASAMKSQKEVKTIEDTLVYFEKQRAEAETNLREMMTQLEQQMAR